MRINQRLSTSLSLTVYITLKKQTSISRPPASFPRACVSLIAVTEGLVLLSRVSSQHLTETEPREYPFALHRPVRMEPQLHSLPALNGNALKRHAVFPDVLLVLADLDRKVVLSAVYCRFDFKLLE